MYEIRDVRIPMRDGVCLAADIFLPNKEARTPALLALSPYGKGKQSLIQTPQEPGTQLWDGGVEAGDPHYLTANGYAHVIADHRGTGKSDGDYRGWMSKQEGQDGHDVVEWIATQPWCDGNVGMVGISAFGTTQLHTAIEQPPHLKAIMPWNAPADFYRECTHHGGILHTFFYDLYLRSARGRNISVTREEYDAADFELMLDTLKKDPNLRKYTRLWNTVDNPGFNASFLDVIAHPFDGPFYWERSAYRHYDKIRIPFYARSAWWAYAHMHLFGTFDHLAGIKAPGKIRIDPPVEETRPLDEEYNAEAVRWYDYWLKGHPNGTMDVPKIKYYLMGADEWRSADQWPLAGTAWLSFFLRPDGRLETEDSKLGEGSTDFVQLPLDQSQVISRARFVTEPLTRALEVVGPISLSLFAAIDQTDTNWIVALKDLAPTGSERELSRGFLKASHRELDVAASKPWRARHPHLQAVPVTPGEVNSYEIALAPTANRFQAGHSIVLEIMSMDRRGDPAPTHGIAQDHLPTHLCSTLPTRHTLFHGGAHASRLLLPIVQPS
jgi:uncharacterized protein